MAEAFGVGAGIVGVIGLTIQITQVVVQFGLDWENAPKEVKGFSRELRSLKTVLSETRTNFLDDPTFKEAFQARKSILLSQLGPNAPAATDTKLSIDSCKAELEKVLDKLKKRGEGNRIGWERLKGSFLTKSTRDSMEDLRHYFQAFNGMFSMDALTLGVNIHTEVREARREQKEWHNDEEYQKILTWISTLSFEEKQTDILSKRHPGTGEWLLVQDEFRSWRNDVSDVPSVLWCPGIIGAGKSVMTSIVIEHLQRFFTADNASISYIYCDYKDRESQTTINLISSLVRQVVLQLGDMPEELRDLYTKHGKGQSSLSLEEFSRLLSSLSNHFGRSLIVVDALDEHFNDKDKENAMQMALLDVLLPLQQHVASSKGYKLFFTSRDHGRIEERLKGYVRLDIRAANSDIELYLRSQITKFSFADKVRNDADLGNLIVRRLVENSQGMFLLPRLHLARLDFTTSVRSLREALKSLPTKIDDIYDEAMKRIGDQHEDYEKLAKSALSWISNALRPLHIDELRHALAVSPGDPSLDKEALVDQTRIISASAGLITLDAQSSTIRLAHFSVEEYFRSRKQALFPDADSQIAKTCLTYLSFDTFENGRCSSAVEYEARLEVNCLLAYAARNWGHHAYKAKEHTVEDLALGFLWNSHRVACSNQVMRMPDYIGSDNDKFLFYDDMVVPRQVSGVHLAARFGLVSIIERFIEDGAELDYQDSQGQTPLLYAAQGGHERVVKLLVDVASYVEADSKDLEGRTPLSHAAQGGHERVVKLLVDVKSDVEADSKDVGGRTPLSHAVQGGYERVVKLLLDVEDVKVNSKDRVGRTPLSYAARGGYEMVVKLLVDVKDVKVNSKDQFGQIPLSYAAQGGHERVVKLLMDVKNVEVDSEDEDGQTPLSHAAQGGYERVVKLLVDVEDVKVDSKDQFGRTPLSYAAQGGYERVVKLLIDRGDVVPDSKDKLGQTPLSYAAQGGYERVVKLLMDRDNVVANSKDMFGRTPLSHAAMGGYEMVVKLLVDVEGVEVDSEDKDGQTPLLYAIAGGHKTVVKLLEEALKLSR